MPKDDLLLSAAECSKLIGLSVRTLRVYEVRGLLSPQRTSKGWRVYGRAELTRLGEILTLKSLGLSLVHIHEVLSRENVDLGRLLSAQEAQLRAQQDTTAAMLTRLAALEARMELSTPLTVDDLLTLAKETNAMTIPSDSTAWKRYEQMRPRSAIKMPPQTLRDAPGAYHFGGQTYGEVTARFRKLYLQLIGQPKVRLLAEGPDQLFAKVVPAQLTLTRDADGEASGMTLHQNGQEISAPRISADTFATAKDALNNRRVNKTPHPQSEALLRKLLASQIAGAPDFTLLAPALAEVVREQQELLQAELEASGPLQRVRFKDVSPDGADIFTLTFANESTDCAISLGSDGLIRGFFIGPAL